MIAKLNAPSTWTCTQHACLRSGKGHIWDRDTITVVQVARLTLNRPILSSGMWSRSGSGSGSGSVRVRGRVRCDCLEQNVPDLPFVEHDSPCLVYNDLSHRFGAVLHPKQPSQ